VLGFNILSGFMPLGDGTNIMDLEDFIVSSNILPIGSLIYVLFCTLNRKGWGWDNYIEEVNAGQGLKVPKKLKVYCKYILPVLLIAFWLYGILSKFVF
jgi:NSS family neurotransmitter:Na+ symporter